MNWTDLITALALVLIIEGAVIALGTESWRRAVTQLLQQSNDSLRTFGLIFVVAGAAILWFAS